MSERRTFPLDKLLQRFFSSGTFKIRLQKSQIYDKFYNIGTWSRPRKRRRIPSDGRPLSPDLGPISVLVVHGERLAGAGHPRTVHGRG